MPAFLRALHSGVAPRAVRLTCYGLLREKSSKLARPMMFAMRSGLPEVRYLASRVLGVDPHPKPQIPQRVQPRHWNEDHFSHFPG
jgi:hypothetical protein